MRVNIHNQKQGQCDKDFTYSFCYVSDDGVKTPMVHDEQTKTNIGI